MRLVERTESIENDEKRGMFIYDRESVVMRKWQILEFDGKPYYAFVPENDDPLDGNYTPEVNKSNTTGLPSDLKEEIITDDYDYDEETLENDSSFYRYDDLYDNTLSNDEDKSELSEMKPSTLKKSNNEGKKNSHGNLYQVKVEGSMVTLEQLEENVEEESEMQILTRTLKQEPSHEISDYEMNETLVDVLDEVDMAEDSIVEDCTVEDAIVEDCTVQNLLLQNSILEEHQEEEEPEAVEFLPSDEEEKEEEQEEEEEEEEEEEAEKIIATTKQYRRRGPSQNTGASSGLPRTVGGPLKCKVCSETFGSAIAFRKHVAWTHKKKVCIQEDGAYICSVCDYRTLKKSLFAAHLERKHETWTRKRQSSLEFPCDTCGFICRSKHSLQSHFIRKHTDKFGHACNFCDKKFKVKGDLTNHIRFHHKEKPINCDVCGKLCQNTGSLYVHKKWAHYKPKYECHICKRRMVTQENLDQHLITQHERREKIICAQCGKTFTKKDSFRRHMAVHAGSKPHPCPICTKPFARQSQLRQHVLIHTGQRPFACDICGKTFTQKPGLICHRKTHPGPHAPLPVMPIADLVRDFIAQNEESQSQEIDLD